MQRFYELKASELDRTIAAKKKELLASEHERTYRKMPAEAFEEHVRYMVRKDLAVRHAEPFDAWVAAWERA